MRTIIVANDNNYDRLASKIKSRANRRILSDKLVDQKFTIWNPSCNWFKCHAYVYISIPLPPSLSVTRSAISRETTDCYLPLFLVQDYTSLRFGNGGIFDGKASSGVPIVAGGERRHGGCCGGI